MKKKLSNKKKLFHLKSIKKKFLNYETKYQKYKKREVNY